MTEQVRSASLRLQGKGGAVSRYGGGATVALFGLRLKFRSFGEESAGPLKVMLITEESLEGKKRFLRLAEDPDG